MTAMSIQCAAGHPRRTVALVADLMGWDVSPPEFDMARRPTPLHGYSFQCTCGAGVAVDKDDMHLIVEQAWEREGINKITLQVLAKARRWHHGIRKPEPIREHERSTP